MAFLLLPYPVMMFACSYFLYDDGLFSYAGFAAIEVILVSTVSACLLLIDAISALKCITPKENKVNVEGAARVAAGADYESEDENTKKRIMKK